MASNSTEIQSANSSTLDLSAELGSRVDLRPACVDAWRLLSATNVTSVVLPSDLVQRRALARSGAITAALRAGAALVVDGSTVSLEEALDVDSPLPGIDWKTYTGSEDLRRLRIIDDLERPQRRPPEPLPDGRRYRWIDGLRAATALGSDAARFNGDADQVLYEAISNVSRWSKASAAFASFSMTAGGGNDSFNRVHIVVADNGVGIIDSVDQRRFARRLSNWRDEQSIQDLAEQHDCSVEAALVLHLVEDAYGNRSVASTQDGHGLHTSGVLARQWSGSFDLRTAGTKKEIVVSRTGRDPFEVTENVLRSAGTLFHVTLEACPLDDSATSAPSELHPARS